MVANVSLRRGIAPADMESLLKWANARGEDFLRQFAGPKWRYPLTVDQVAAEAGSVYSIHADGRFAGIVQLLFRREGRAHIGRFLLDPARTGEGIGAAALMLFCRRLFEDAETRVITLRVYRFNGRAIRCYRKCGFEFDEPDGGGDPWDSLAMTLRRESLSREGETTCPAT